MSFMTKTMTAVALACLLIVPTSSAATYDIDVSGIDSWDGAGSANNTVIVVDLAAALGFASGTALTVTGVGWNVVIESFDPSWLSEIPAGFENSDGSDFLDLSVGAGSDTPGGPTSFSSGGVVDLASIDPTLPIDLFDGVLVIEFFESFDDDADVIDGFWIDGTLTVDASPIPVPAALPLLLSALGFARIIGRRRGS